MGMFISLNIEVLGDGDDNNINSSLHLSQGAIFTSTLRED